MASRARKILGLIVQNDAVQSPCYNDNKDFEYEKYEAENKQLKVVPYSDGDVISDTTETENNSKKSHCRVSSSSCSSTSSSSSSSASSSSNDDVIENTPPQQPNLENRKFELHRDTKGTTNYYTSPVYTEESDIDLSDSDPTFVNVQPKKKRNYFFYRSSSSSTTSSSSDKVNCTAKRGLKRIRNPGNWKQNKIKHMRNMGKSYISMAKSRNSIPARSLKEPCKENCRIKCTTKISTESRYKLFQSFWNLGDLTQQRAYISSNMIDIELKYKYSNAEKPRNNNKAYHFIVNNNTIRVCKTFFKATLDISDRMILTVQKKMHENDFSLSDMRGRHQSHRKISPELRNAIIQHIQSIPKIESHYLRASTSRQYIDGSKTIKDLYRDFKIKQEEDHKEAGTYIIYYKIFTTESNLSFFQPKKDQCDLCNSYYNSTPEQKKDLEEKYQT